MVIERNMDCSVSGTYTKGYRIVPVIGGLFIVCECEILPGCWREAVAVTRYSNTAKAGGWVGGIEGSILSSHKCSEGGLLEGTGI